MVQSALESLYIYIHNLIDKQVQQARTNKGLTMSKFENTNFSRIS